MKIVGGARPEGPPPMATPMDAPQYQQEVSVLLINPGSVAISIATNSPGLKSWRTKVSNGVLGVFDGLAFWHKSHSLPHGLESCVISVQR